MWPIILVGATAMFASISVLATSMWSHWTLFSICWCGWGHDRSEVVHHPSYPPKKEFVVPDSARCSFVEVYMWLCMLKVLSILKAFKHFLICVYVSFYQGLWNVFKGPLHTYGQRKQSTYHLVGGHHTHFEIVLQTQNGCHPRMLSTFSTPGCYQFWCHYIESTGRSEHLDFCCAWLGCSSSQRKGQISL